MEYVDSLDDRGKPTGETASRDVAHQRGLWHLVVHIWIVNSKNEVLLQKRVRTKKTYPDMWGMSTEGHIIAGQTSLDGAQRELNEELGLTIAPAEIHHLMTYKHASVIYVDSIRNHYIDVYLIKKDIDIKDIIIQEEELSAVKWMPLTDYLRELEAKNPDYRTYPEEMDFLLKTLKN